MSNVQVEVDAGHAQRAIQTMLDRVGKEGAARWLETKMQPWLAQRIKGRFASEGDDASGKWAQLMESTAHIRQSAGYKPYHPINVRSGHMLTHLLTSYTISGGDTLNVPGRAGGLIGEKIRVAQRGGGGRRRGTHGRVGPNRPAPPRPVLGVSGLDVMFAENSFGEWLNSRV